MASIEQITTAEQLLRAPGLGRCELVRGELVMISPPGYQHGRIIIRVTAALLRYLDENPLGVLTAAETGFQIGHDPDTVRAPDVGLVLSERDPGDSVKGYYPGPPDLAVEVLSPDDRAGEVLAKVRDWLQAGGRRVWVIDPQTRTVSVYRSASQIVVLSDSDTLSDEDLLPGFHLPVAEIFAM
jgi:Uma2 family endonuclease